MVTESRWWARSTSRNERSGTRSALLSTRSVGWSSRPELGEHLDDGPDLLLGLGAGGVDDVQQQVGLAGLLERRLERGDQGVRQVADEADRVGEQGLPAPLEPPLAGAGVERGEELVLDQHARVGQGVHQRALAGVGVADQRDGRHVGPAGDLALLRAWILASLRLEVLDPVADQPAVFLELLLAGAADADAALVARQVGPHPLQPGHGVLELGQLDLEVGLVGARMGGEDVEDHLGAVDDLDVEGSLEVARLGGAQVVVEDDDVGLVSLDQLLQLLDLARADVGGDVDLLPLLEHGAGHVKAGRLGQARESRPGGRHGSCRGRGGSPRREWHVPDAPNARCVLNRSRGVMTSFLLSLVRLRSRRRTGEFYADYVASSTKNRNGRKRLGTAQHPDTWGFLEVRCPAVTRNRRAS